MLRAASALAVKIASSQRGAVPVEGPPAGYRPRRRAPSTSSLRRTAARPAPISAASIGAVRARAPTTSPRVPGTRRVSPCSARASPSRCYADQRGSGRSSRSASCRGIVAAADFSASSAGSRAARARARAVPRRRLRATQRILRDNAGSCAEMVLGASQLPAAACAGSPAGRRAHPHRRHRSRSAIRRHVPACSRTTCARRRACRTSIENRLITKRDASRSVFDAGARPPRRPLPDPARRDAALACRPVDARRATAVVLTPGPYNSAYFEHSFLRAHDGPRARRGARICSSTATTVSTCARRAARARVDVIYRRIDDAFLDPEVFRPDSLLGVRGLMRAYARRQRRARERARQRRRRRQGGLPVRARHDPLLPARGADPRAGADATSARATTIAQLRRSSTSTSSW